MNDTTFKTGLNNKTSHLSENVQENDTIIIIIRNGEVICCTQNSLCSECACRHQA